LGIFIFFIFSLKRVFFGGYLRLIVYCVLKNNHDLLESVVEELPSCCKNYIYNFGENWFVPAYIEEGKTRSVAKDIENICNKFRNRHGDIRQSFNNILRDFFFFLEKYVLLIILFI
jgi:hypothetical protein